MRVEIVMNKVAMFAVGALVFFCSAAGAESVKGGFCRIEGMQVDNTGTGVTQQKLWEYTGAKLPETPLLGYIDIACADRGIPRSVLQDFGKRVYFNVSGPEAGAPSSGQLSVNDPSLNTGVEGETGISVNHLAIYSIVTPKHVCAYEVWLWKPDCSSHN